MSHTVLSERARATDGERSYATASPAVRMAERFASFLGKYSFAIVVLFTAFYALCALVRARQEPLWHDELYTYYLSSLTASDLWRALAGGVDLTPPAHHLLAKASRTLFGDNALAVRMPAVIGVWALCVSLFSFVRRRCNPVYALLALLVPCATLAFRYSYEARPYGMLLGCAGVALACWQVAHTQSKRKLALFGLAASLAAASGTHYYGILLIGPLAAAELFRSLQARRADLPIWFSFGAAGLPLLIFWPLIAAARSFSKSFWSTGGPGAVVDTYLLFLGSGVLPVLVAFILAPLISVLLPPSAAATTQRRTAAQEGFTAPELLACAGFAVLPIVQIVLSQLATGAYVYRYALPAIAGLSILFVWFVFRTTRQNAVASVLILAVFAGWFAREAMSSAKLLRKPRESVTVPLLLDRVPAGTPVVVSEPMLFLQLAHYAPRDLAARMFYLVDLALPGAFSESNTVERNFDQLRRWQPLFLVDYKSFVDTRSEFALFHRRSHDGRVWLLSQLLADGWQVTLTQQLGEDLLYTVRRTQISTAGGPKITGQLQ